MVKKLELLSGAKALPVFRDHHVNSILKGGWGRTSALRQIEEKEAELQPEVSSQLSQ